MENLLHHIFQLPSVTRFGYVIYRPKTKRIKQDIHYNHEADQILSFTEMAQGKESGSSSALSNICERWRKTLEKRLKDTGKSGEKEALTGPFIELVQSGKRKYVVRGTVLYDHLHFPKGQNQYLFILERIRSDLLNIPQISREWHLNNREQD